MRDAEKCSFRLRLDPIVFRLDKRLYDALESQCVLRPSTSRSSSLSLADHNQRARAGGTNLRKFHNMELYLSVLSEYMVNCPTRVMSSQVIEVCLETLLRLKVRQSLSPARELECRT